MLQHIEAELDDKTALLRRRDELVGRNAPVQRMLPAHQSLKAGDRIVLQPHDRLVDEIYIAGLQCLAQLAVYVDAAAAHPECRLLELDVNPAVKLCPGDRPLRAAPLLLPGFLRG